LETAWNGSPEAQLAVRSLTPNFQSPEFARGLGRDRFAFRADRFAIASRTVQAADWRRADVLCAWAKNDAGRTDCALGPRRLLLDQANPSCALWAQAPFVGSGEPELLFLFRPDGRQIADEPGDGQIGMRPALGPAGFASS
jgi:hypothetical protein